MAAIISMVARASGTATFSDRTTEYYSCTIDEDGRISTANGSSDTVEKIGSSVPYWLRENLVIYLSRTYPTSAVVNTTVTDATKTITDLVAKFELIFALDDNTNYQQSGTYDSKGGYVTTQTPGISTPTNLSAYYAILQTMLLTVYDTAVVL